MIQDSAVNQHQHMIFIIISKQIKSLSTFFNEIQIIQSYNYDPDLVVHDSSKGRWYNTS